jgi:YVTN family beta-propeller protein
MKRTLARWIPAFLVLCATLAVTGCATNTPSKLKKLEQDNPGLVVTCKASGDGNGEVQVVQSTPETQEAADSINGDNCDPSEEETQQGGQGGNSQGRLGGLRSVHRGLSGTTTTITDDPQPQIISQAIEPANSSSTPAARLRVSATAGASYQLQDEYSNLLPIPFTPLFSPTALANYTPACNPNASFYMANYDNSTVTHLASCPLAVLKVIQVPSNPVQVRITPDGSTAVVTTYNNTIAFINTATDTVTTLSTPQYNPYGIAISPDGTKAYVTSYSTAVPNLPVIFTINMATRQIMPQTLEIQQGNSSPKSIFLTPDGALAWVNFSQTPYIQIIDTLTMTVSTTLNAGGVADTGIAFSPDGTRAYVSVYSGSVAVFNTATLTQVASIAVGGQPTDILVSKAGGTAFVNSFATNGVTSVINTASNTVIGTIPNNGPSMGLTLFH